MVSHCLWINGPRHATSLCRVAIAILVVLSARRRRRQLFFFFLQKEHLSKEEEVFPRKESFLQGISTFRRRLDAKEEEGRLIFPSPRLTSTRSHATATKSASKSDEEEGGRAAVHLPQIDFYFFTSPITPFPSPSLLPLGVGALHHRRRRRPTAFRREELEFISFGRRRRQNFGVRREKRAFCK